MQIGKYQSVVINQPPKQTPHDVAMQTGILFVLMISMLFAIAWQQPVWAADSKQSAAYQTSEDGWEVHTIKAGDSLAQLFRNRGLKPAVLTRVLRSGKAAKALNRIRPGQTLHFLRNQKGRLLELVFVKSLVESVHIQAHKQTFKAKLKRKKAKTRIANAGGVIQSSLFSDGRKAGLDEKQIMELASLFRWDIDFSLELRPGDQFRVLYEEKVLDGQKWRNGPILAAEFINRGKSYQAFLYKHKNGDIEYYNAKGYSKRRAFIRSPLKFGRVSSKFTKRRWHPILQRWRSHKGVDYAAPTGTPIKSTGRGHVIFRGRKSGYGRVVIVEHSDKYRTLYAHMSRFAKKVKVGSRVEQGQVVGYVGQSGLATGPHLHYEFRVNGVHRNPLTVKLPKSLRLPRKKLASFKRKAKPLKARLAAIKPATMIASKSAN